MAERDLKDIVKDKYGKAALRVSAGGDAACCDSAPSRGERDPIECLEVEQPAEEDTQFVSGPLRLGRDPPVVGEPLAVEEAEGGLRVPDVDREQHRCEATAPAAD